MVPLTIVRARRRARRYLPELLASAIPNRTAKYDMRAVFQACPSNPDRGVQRNLASRPGEGLADDLERVFCRVTIGKCAAASAVKVDRHRDIARDRARPRRHLVLRNLALQQSRPSYPMQGPPRGQHDVPCDFGVRFHPFSFLQGTANHAVRKACLPPSAEEVACRFDLLAVNVSPHRLQSLLKASRKEWSASFRYRSSKFVRYPTQG